MSAIEEETAILSVPHEERFRFGAAFASFDLEQQYRQSQLASNRLVATWCVIAIVFGGALFISTDYRFFGQSSRFFVLLALRGACFVASAIALILLRGAGSPRSFNAILASWAMLVSLGAAYINSTRPPTYSGNMIITVEMVLMTYCVLPLPLGLQILCASINSLAMPIIHGMGQPGASGMTSAGVIQSFFIANLLGILTSMQLHRRKRQLFAAAERQRELAAGLERAMAEIRTLRGILPICAHCRRIMNEAGGWEPFEVYVSKHTHAEFTHDICPECAKKHFGDS